MQMENKRFQLKRLKFETKNGRVIERYIITDNLLTIREVNQWIEAKSLRKVSTGKYAEKL